MQITHAAMKLFRLLPVLLSLSLPLFAGAGEVQDSSKDGLPTQRKSVPRRAVPDQRPYYAAPVIPSPPSVRVVPPVILPGTAAPSAPAPLGTCDGAGCWNSEGGRYNGGTGNTYLNNGGRLCNRNGASVQCF
jgi:hypothetical protein